MKEGQLQVWWIPQIPMEAFYWGVKTVDEAKSLLDCLAQYDLFQWKYRVKPDFSNTGGLRVWDLNYDGEGTPGWSEWMDEDGDDIDEHFRRLEEEDQGPEFDSAGFRKEDDTIS